MKILETIRAPRIPQPPPEIVELKISLDKTDLSALQKWIGWTSETSLVANGHYGAVDSFYDRFKGLTKLEAVALGRIHDAIYDVLKPIIPPL